jgi:hypothetical protein
MFEFEIKFFMEKLEQVLVRVIFEVVGDCQVEVL